MNAVPYSVLDDTTSATLEPNEPGSTCGFGMANTVWFAFTPPIPGISYTFSTAGSAFDTILAVYTGPAVNPTMDALNQVGCNDDATTKTFSSKVVLTLSSAVTYYIQLGGYNGRFGNYTLTVQQTTLPKPAQVMLAGPANGSFGNDATPHLSWNSAANAAKYQVQISRNYTFTQLVQDVPPDTPLYYDPQPPLASGLYYWRVRGLNANGQPGLWSAYRSFTVGLQKLPRNGASTTDTTPTFSWNKNTLGGTSYTLQVDNNSDFLSNEYTCTNTPALLTCTATPLGFGQYYWRVNVDGVLSEVVFTLWVTTPLPAAPALVSPPSGATLYNTPSLLLDWNATTSTLGSPFTYHVQIDDQYTFSSPLVPEPSGLLDTKYTPTLPGNGKYYWRVATVNTYGAQGPWSAYRSFTVIAPPTPVLNAPADGSLTAKVRPTFSWYAAKAATRYHLQVGADADPTVNVICDFSAPVVDVIVPSSVLSYTVPTAHAPLAQGLYCWRVTALDAAGNPSSASDEYNLIVSLTLKPANASAIVSATAVKPTFQWAAFPGAGNMYNVQVDNDADFSSPIYEETLATTSFTPDAPDPTLSAGTYYWRVIVSSDSLPPDEAVESWFAVSSGRPGVPALSSPLNGAFVPDGPVQLCWIAPAGGAASYEVQVDNDQYFTAPEFSGAIASPSLCLTTDTLLDGKYFWRARALNADGAPGNWSAARTFTVDTVNPGVPVLIAPVINASTTVTKPTFSWKAAAGAKKYEIEWGTNSSFTPALHAQVSTLTFVPPSPLLYTTYYWHVRALDAAGNSSAFSQTRTLKIVSAATATPALNRYAPGNPAPMNLPPTLSWGPISWTSPGGYYQVQVDNNNTFTSPEYANMSIPTGTQSVTIDPPLPDGTWYWRVRACTAANACGAWSTTGTFTVES